MRIALSLILGLCTILLWLPLFSEILCLLFRRPRTPDAMGSSATLPRILFLVPAHNEELMIRDCVRSLLTLDYPTDARGILVVADNCSDSTARLVRSLGVECLERLNPQMRGKPHCIAWALSTLDLKQWDTCVIVDADSTVARDFALGVAKLGRANDIVFQPNNLVLNEYETWLTRLGGLLGRCRFEVILPLKESAGLNCPIGNGMGIGTNLLMRDGWRSYSVAEDSALYAIYSAEGVRIRLARHANIYSQESRALSEGATQRRRWLGGRIRLIIEMGGRIMRSAKIGWRQKLDIFVELGLTGPVLHLTIAVGVVGVALVGVGGQAGDIIAFAAVTSLTGMFAATLLTIARHPEPGRTLFAFVMLPAYAIWRFVVLVATIFTLQDTTWRRSARALSPAPARESSPTTD